MNILRLSWSDYQTDESLRREKREIEDAGFLYRRANQSMDVPEDLDDFEIILINSQCEIDSEFLNEWNQTGTIITASNGYDHIDCSRCDRLGVTVIRIPQTRAPRVVDHSIGFVYSLLRYIPQSDRRLRNGHWVRTESFQRIRRFSSLSFGIFGFGVIGERIGRQLYERFDPYEILAYDPHKQGTIESTSGIEFVPRNKFFERTNVLMIHANLNQDTLHSIDGKVLERLQSPSYLINTARGEIVVWSELLQALDENQLSGAAVDVFPEDFSVYDTRSLPDSLLTTPHAAGFGPGMLQDLTEEIVDVLKNIDGDHHVPHVVVEGTMLDG